MSNKLKKNERWVSGLSDCCEAPLKEIGSGLTILTCSECGQMCNKKWDEEDDYPDDDDDDADDMDWDEEDSDEDYEPPYNEDEL